MKQVFSLAVLLLITAPLSASPVYHKHGNRGHAHVLPKPQGLNHQHGGGQARPTSSQPQRSPQAHYHGRKVHTHVLPGGHQIAHRHGNSAIGQAVNRARPPRIHVPPSRTRRYICSELSQAQARTLYRAGHTYLDRDRDGHPCEPHDYPVYTRSNNSSCHWVSGYYRRSGSYVRGHRRCR